MKIYVVGSSKNKFLPLDNIREKFIIDEKHEGVNMDFLNPWYCELTGLFYLWKNVNDDIVGLEHYRRYHLNSKLKLLSESEITDILKTHDIICTKEDGDGLTLEQRFRTMRNEFTYLMNAVKELYPEQYDSLKQFIKQRWHWQFNMFICRKELLNQYCEWLFPILLSITEKYKTNIKKRSIGYLAEIILFSFYFTVINKKKIFQSTYRLQRL